MSVNRNVRNVLIVVAIAAVVALVPGGGTTANVVIQAVSLAFLAALLWVASIMYREHRTQLYSLGEGRRAALYAAAAVLAVTLTATAQLWRTSAGSVAWLVLVGASIYTGGAVIWAARKY
jgi:drug/metabolite transporter (DMT)-like permease